MPIPPPPPDVIDTTLNQRKRYRLVIGAGENSTDPSMNRSFVDPTASLVDSRLAGVGFKPLPSLASTTPYLAGPAATKQAIMTAINEMVSVTSGQDYGVIYYVGHGSITWNNLDLTLGVYDRPVTRDDGVRVSDILGVLEFTDWHSNVTEIPHYLLVLDACFSGNTTLADRAILTTRNNVQRVEKIQDQIVPPQIAILTATSDGDSNSAYELRGTNASAFGYYFARAVKEDWACSDSITPDGILTLNELTTYLRNRLKLASDQGYTDALMVPTILNRDENAFIAYDASKHAIDGLRSEVVALEIHPTQADQVATVTLQNGSEVQCATDRCILRASRSLLGNMSVKSLITVLPGRSLGARPSTKLAEGRVDLQQLLHDRQVSVADVQLTIR
jgi:hypothetical protein